MTSLLAQQIRQGLTELALVFSDHQVAQLQQLLLLLNQWNPVYNLTAIREESQQITHHLLDSLAILPALKGNSFIDVGTGAGFPGLPLAIMKPEAEIVLLDSNSKKTRFIRHVLAQLSLAHCQVVQARVEQYRCANLFDGILSRAFSGLDDFCQMTSHLRHPKGHWYAMKGTKPQQTTTLPEGVSHCEVISLQVPGLEAERCLVCLR